SSPLPVPALSSLLSFLQSHHPPRDLHSFPTRRSSDLPWTLASPIPTAARAVGADSDGTYIYAYGSFYGGGTGSEFARYNPMSNRSEEHTSELQSPYDLVCRLLLEKKKTT